MLVMKFGGTSVKDAAAVDRVSQIILRRVEERPIVVVSATGDTTDRLEEILALLDEGHSGAQDIARAIGQRHRELIAAVVTDPDQADRARRTVDAEMERLVGMIDAMERLGDVSARSRDAVLATGERISAPILAASLASRGVDAVYVDPSTIMVTDDRFGAAQPDLDAVAARCNEHLAPLCAQAKVPVMGGYVGATPRGVLTTLGRGGSDLTAAVVARSVQASGLIFWKDVDGILTADPRIVPHARPLDLMTFAEAAELTFLGSGVLHPASVAPAVEANVPVIVRNSYKPDAPGTKIVPAGSIPAAELAKQPAASITYKKNQALINVYSTRMLGASGFLRRVFEVFDRLHVSVDHIATSEVNVTVTVQDTAVLPQLEEALAAVATVSVRKDVSVISVVGEGLRTTPGIAAAVFGAVADINVLFITHGGATTNLSFVVDNSQREEAVRRLHRALFE